MELTLHLDAGDLFTREHCPEEVLVVLDDATVDGLFPCIVFYKRGKELHWRAGHQSVKMFNDSTKRANLLQFAQQIETRCPITH
jgi:hypothetical protein